MLVRTLLLSLYCLLIVGTTEAKSWRGIVPLKSTRADVERLLGKENSFGRYQFAEERAYIFYRENPCLGVFRPLEEDNCECFVSKDTVVSIHVTLELAVKFASLHLDKTKYERIPHHVGPGFVDYRSLEEGVTYTVDESHDEIIGIEYMPSDSDCNELNARNLPGYRNAWRGLVPLHGTRTEVERLLGAPDRVRESLYTYRNDNESVTVRYSTGTCKQGENDWNVPAGTIIEFWVNPVTTITVRGLRLDSHRFQREETSPLPENLGKLVNYTDAMNGVKVRAEFHGEAEEVISITYSPAKKDDKLRCQK